MMLRDLVKRYKDKEKPIIATVPPSDEPEPLVRPEAPYYVDEPRRIVSEEAPHINSGSRNLTEAQGERIIELLEQLVEQTERPAPLPPGPALDKLIAEDIKRHSVSYPSGS